MIIKNEVFVGGFAIFLLYWRTILISSVTIYRKCFIVYMHEIKAVLRETLKVLSNGAKRYRHHSGAALRSRNSRRRLTLQNVGVKNLPGSASWS